MKRLTILLDDDTHKKLKHLCVELDTDMSDIVRKLIEKHLEKVDRRKH